MLSHAFFWARGLRRAAKLPLCATAAASFLLLHAPAHAQDLPTVVVTATRVPQRVEATLADVTVIHRDEIERQAGSTLPALLARQPGVQVYQSGGAGKLSAAFIRGGEARHTLLIVDGVRYGSVTTGNPLLENIPLALVERIEIVRGPLSSLYGADAVAGVIQVFTKRGTSAAPAWEAGLTLGSRQTREARAGVSGRQGALDYSVRVSHQSVGGRSATNARAVYDFVPDDDGFRQSAAAVQLGYALTADWALRLSASYGDGVTEFDDGVPFTGPAVNSRSKLRNDTLSLSTRGRITPIWTTELRYGRTTDLVRTVEAASPASLTAARSRQEQWAWQHDVVTPLGTLMAAAERLTQDIGGSTVAAYDSSFNFVGFTGYAGQRRRIDSLVLGLSGQARGHHWQASAREDRNSQYGTQHTGGLSYGYDLTPAWRVSASLGTSFAAPTFAQLYYPGFSNPDLLPEQGFNKDLAVRWLQGAHEAKLVYYNNRVRQAISAGRRPANIPHARFEGATLSYALHLAEWSVTASLDQLRAVNEGTGARLVRRAEQAAALSVDRRWGVWQFGSDLQAMGERRDFRPTDFSTPTARLPGYAIWGLRAQWQASKAVTVAARVDNVGDKDYETVYGYNQPGREWFVSLNWAMP